MKKLWQRFNQWWFIHKHAAEHYHLVYLMKSELEDVRRVEDFLRKELNDYKYRLDCRFCGNKTVCDNCTSKNGSKQLCQTCGGPGIEMKPFTNAVGRRVNVCGKCRATQGHLLKELTPMDFNRSVLKDGRPYSSLDDSDNYNGKRYIGPKPFESEQRNEFGLPPEELQP